MVVDWLLLVVVEWWLLVVDYWLMVAAAVAGWCWFVLVYYHCLCCNWYGLVVVGWFLIVGCRLLCIGHCWLPLVLFVVCWL